jgi:hypothetical protein
MPELLLYGADFSTLPERVLKDGQVLDLNQKV